jgi:putative spermidine/putrescine transport system permease protein
MRGWVGALRVINLLIYVFLLAPVIVVVAIAFSGTSSLAFPPSSLSLRWFAKFATEAELYSALWLSVLLAVSSSLISLAVGGIAAFGLVRGDFPGRAAILNCLMLPLMVPALVIAMAFLEYFATLDISAFPALLIGHTVITLPYVVRSMVAGLSGADILAEQAAISLGATRGQAVRMITLPALTNSVIAAGLFAFIVSFENLPLALFLSDPKTVTLPMQIYSYIQWVFDPTVAAASTVQVIVVVVLVFAAERAAGLSRFMGLAS